MEREIQPLSLQAFLLRQTVANVILNAALNAAIPYFTLSAYISIPVIGGEQDLIRNLLPLYFLLPFLLSLVMLWQAKAEARKGKLSIHIPPQNRSSWFSFRVSLINGMVSLVTAGLLLTALITVADKNTTLPTGIVIIISAASAVLLSIVFSIQPIYTLQKTKA